MNPLLESYPTYKILSLNLSYLQIIPILLVILSYPILLDPHSPASFSVALRSHLLQTCLSPSGSLLPVLLHPLLWIHLTSYVFSLPASPVPKLQRTILPLILTLSCTLHLCQWWVLPPWPDWQGIDVSFRCDLMKFNTARHCNKRILQVCKLHFTWVFQLTLVLYRKLARSFLNHEIMLGLAPLSYSQAALSYWFPNGGGSSQFGIDLESAGRWRTIVAGRILPDSSGRE